VVANNNTAALTKAKEEKPSKTLEDLNKARAARDAIVASKPPKVNTVPTTPSSSSSPAKSVVESNNAAALAKAKADTIAAKAAADAARATTTAPKTIAELDDRELAFTKGVDTFAKGKDDTMYAGGSKTFDETAGAGKGLTSSVPVSEVPLQVGGYNSGIAATTVNNYEDRGSIDMGSMLGPNAGNRLNVGNQVGVLKKKTVVVILA
jgi:hypothetical protein